MNAGGNSTALPQGQRAWPQTGRKYVNTPPLMRQTRQVANSEPCSGKALERVILGSGKSPLRPSISNTFSREFCSFRQCDLPYKEVGMHHCFSDEDRKESQNEKGCYV